MEVPVAQARGIGVDHPQVDPVEAGPDIADQVRRRGEAVGQMRTEEDTMPGGAIQPVMAPAAPEA